MAIGTSHVRHAAASRLCGRILGTPSDADCCDKETESQAGVEETGLSFGATVRASFLVRFHARSYAACGIV